MLIQVRVKAGITVVMETWARVRSYFPDSDDLISRVGVLPATE